LRRSKYPKKANQPLLLPDGRGHFYMWLGTNEAFPKTEVLGNPQIKKKLRKLKKSFDNIKYP
jgi:hypothetical protein